MPTISAEPKVSYGAKIIIAENSSIEYPDFTLTYKGITERAAEFPDGSRGFIFTIYNFEVKKGNDTKTIKWSAGTGDIAPQNFTFNGQNYSIEKIAENTQMHYGGYDSRAILHPKEGEIIIIVFDKDHPPFYGQ
jgi:hypothetical protein